jgi:hypothetical protein
MANGDKRPICPKCGKGQVVCTYLGTPQSSRYHEWCHDCTNPACGLHEEFGAWEEQDPEGNQDEPGPGKDGGCPGPHK